MNRKQRIEHAINEALSPAHLDVMDESDLHAVPRDSEAHFKVLVVSEHFVGMSLLNRHRRLNQLLGGELQTGLHALTLHTWTPEEWHARGGAPASPRCLGGSQAR